MSNRRRLVFGGGVAIASLLVLGFGEPVARAKCMLGGGCDAASVQADNEAPIALASLASDQDLGELGAGERPEIIVLPFRILNSGLKQTDLADQMTDEVILGLAHVPELQVISRDTAFTYGFGTRADEAATELGVRYALQVRMQKWGDMARTNVRLFDAQQGNHILDQDIALSLDELRNLSGIVMHEVANSLDLDLDIDITGSVGESMKERDMGWLPSSTRAVNALREEPNRAASIATARRWIEHALQIDPEDALAWAGLSFAELRLNALGQGEGEASITVAVDAARQATRIDPQSPYAHYVLGYALREAGDVAGSRSEMQTCLDLHPNNASCLQGLAYTEILSGRPEAALLMMAKAMQLSPREPAAAEWNAIHGLAYAMLGDYGRAEELARRAIRRDHGFAPGHELLAVSLAALGRDEEAQQARDRYLRLARMKSFASARLRHEAFSSDQTYRGQLQTYLANLARSGVGTSSEMLLARVVSQN